MFTRRLMLRLPLALPVALAACASGEDAPLPPLVTGYRHLTPLRLNVLEVDIPDPAPGAVAVAPSATLRPDVEMRRMGQERLVPVGTAGRGRFLVTRARFTRERLAPAGGLTSLVAGEPGERFSCEMACRIEVMSAEGGRLGFAEAEARRSQTVAEGASATARNRAAEEVVRLAMDSLNVEFEFQIRRALRAWLVEGNQPLTPAPVEREDLARPS
jgi:hypothetical protein